MGRLEVMSPRLFRGRIHYWAQCWLQFRLLVSKISFLKWDRSLP